MELATKGASANLGGIKQFMVSLKWTTQTDFDLAVFYRAKDSSTGLVYFGGHSNTNGRGNTPKPQLGNLNDFPFMELSGDEGVGDSGDDNSEEMRVMSLDEMGEVYIVCWDYGAVTSGSPARFAGSDVTVSLMDDTGTNHNITLDAGAIGNTAIVAKIDNTSPMGAQFINTSNAGTLKGLDFDAIAALCQ
jgi:tellurite resistance protein TerA